MQSLSSGTGNNETIASADRREEERSNMGVDNEGDVGSLDVERHGPDSSAVCHNGTAQQADDEANGSVGGWRSLSSAPLDVWAQMGRMIRNEVMSIGSTSFGDSIRSRAPDGTIRHSQIFSSQAQHLPGLEETTPHTSRTTSARPSDSSRVEWVEGVGSGRSQPLPNRRGSVNEWNPMDQYASHPDIDFVAEATLVIEDTPPMQEYRETQMSSDGTDTFVQMDRAYNRLDGVRRSEGRGSIGVRSQRLMSGRLVDARSITTEEDFRRFTELARRRDGVHDQQPPTYDQLARGLMAIGGNATDDPNAATSINRLSDLVDGRPEYWLSSLVNGQQELQDQHADAVIADAADAYVDDDTLSTGFPIRDVEVQEDTIAEAQPLHNKFIVSRATTALLAIVVVGLIALSLGFGLSPDNTENVSSHDLSYEDDDVVAYAPEDICFSLLPVMSNHSLACPDPTTQLTRGGPVCQLVADALLYAHRQSEEQSNIDVSIINGGAVRGDIFRGNVTAGIIRKEIIPFFGNRVVYLSVSPAEIYQTLNGALVDTGRIFTTDEQEMFFPEANALDYRWAYESSYPYAGGLQFDVNLNAPEGEKVTNACA